MTFSTTSITRNLADGTQAVEFYLEGVHCAACVWLVEKLPQVRPGVLESRLDMRRAIVEVRWDPKIVKLSQIAGTLDSLGYPPHPAKDIRTRQMRRDENRRFLIRIGVAAACVGNVMMLAFALYGGVFTGIEAQYAHLFRWASMLFGLIALAWPGSLFFRGAWAALRTKTAHLDLPIAIGLAAGGMAGTVNAILGRGEIYFDSLTMLVLLLLVGRWLQRRQQCWANDALELLFSLTPTSARRLENGAVVEVPIEAVQPGDLVEVRAGDSIPADGSVLEGQSSVNRALLTGESQPTAVGPGSAVHAGTVNLSTRLVVRGRGRGRGDPRRPLDAVGRAAQPQPAADRAVCRSHCRPLRADRAGRGRDDVSVLGLVQSRQSDRQRGGAAHRHLPLCPGTGHAAGRDDRLGRAARRHILVKGGEVLRSPQPARRDVAGQDRARSPRGGSRLVSWNGDEGSAAVGRGAGTAFGPSDRPGPGCDDARYAGEKSGGIDEDLRLAMLCKPRRRHRRHGCRTAIGRRFAANSCGSRAARFRRDRACRAGDDRRDRHAGAGGRRWPRGGRGRIGRSAAAGRGRLAGPLAQTRLEDPHSLRRSSRGGRGHRAAVGDRRRPTRSAGPRRRPSWRSSARHRPGGPVVMVGDGVNDAAALSAASVGIAVHGGAEASLAAAHVYLDRPGLAPILELMHAARSTLGAIRRCFVASICYNSLAGTLAVTGVISPLTAAILMPISSFTVFALAYAVRTFGDGKR